VNQKTFFIIVLVSLLTACGTTTSPDAIATDNQITPSSTDQPVTPMPEKTATSESSPPRATPSQQGNDVNMPVDAVVIFHRSGGFAGVDERWTMYSDGRIVKSDGEQQQVESEEVQALLETIQDTSFFELADSYIPEDTCCDRFTYSITVQLDGRVKTVSTLDASPTQPDGLTTVNTAISELIFR
jgi:hypothetical protein